MDDPRYSYSIQDSYTWSGGEDGQQHAQVASQQQFLRHVMNSEDSAARSGPSQAPFPAAMGSPVPTRNYYDYSPPAYGSPNTFITHPQLRPTVIPSQPLSALYSPSASPAAQPQTLVPEPVLSGSHGIGGSTSLIPGTSAAYYPDPVAAGFEKRQYAPSTRTTLSEYKAPLTGPVRTSMWRVRNRPYQESVQPAGSADTRRRASREQAEGIGLVDRPTSTQVHQSSNVSGPEETLSLAEHSLPNCEFLEQKQFLQAPADFSGHLLSHHQYSSMNDTNMSSGINLSTSPRSDHLDQGGEFSNWQEMSRQNHSPGVESYHLAEHYDSIPTGSDSSSHPHSDDGTNGGWSTHSASPMLPRRPSISTSFDNGVGLSSPSGMADFINSNLSHHTSAALDPSEDYPEHNDFFPLQTEECRRLRIAMHNVMTAAWKIRNELEPTPRDILQFSQREVGPDGSVKYRCLLWHNNERCGKSWGRSERMAAHLRGAIDLRPFPCEGDDEACNCGLRFFAEDTLQQHRKNAKTIPCEYCSNPVTPRNIKRHLRHNCAKSPHRAS